MKITSGKHLFFIGMALALMVGAALRFYHLSSVPPGISYDEARYGDKALYFLSNHFVLIYYTIGEIQIGLFPALLAMGFAVFGDTIIAPRAVLGLLGCISLIGSALLTLELLKDNKYKRPVALIATAMLAISYWHLNFSRLMFSASIVPVSEVFSFYLTLLAFRYGNIKIIIAAGVVTALGFFTYWQYYSFIILPGGIALFYLISDRAKYQKPFLQYAAAFIIVMLPLLYGFYENAMIPQLSIMKRPAQLMVEPSGLWHYTVLNIKSLFIDGMGDGNWRHNFSRQAHLAPLARLGVIASIFYFMFLLVSRKRTENDNVKAIALLLIWCIAALIPSAFSGGGSASRMVGMVVPLHILAAIGIFWILRLLYIIPAKILPPKLVIFCLGSVLLAALTSQAMVTFHQYFYIFANSQDAKDAFITFDRRDMKHNFVQEALELNCTLAK